MRILWLSNAPWSPSGYGEQTAMFVPRLANLGHDLGIAANYGLGGAKFPLGDIPIYPANLDWGNPLLGSFASDFQADFVIALCDAWVLKPQMWPEDLRVAVWAPIDHWPIPPAVLAVLQDAKVRPIAMSRFGENWMQRFGLEPLYVPHGVDTDIFKPRPGIRDDVRAELGVPADAFLVGMVAANKGNPSIPRKSFPQAFDAFAQFAAKHKDAYLYVHTQSMPEGGGIDLETLVRVTQCPLDRVKFPPMHLWHLGMGRQLVANLYPAFDVLLNPAMGEGFGIPILEAQACGCPVVTSDHSAMTELTVNGWMVEGDRWWDALQESFLIIPSIASIREKLEVAYDYRGDEVTNAAGVEWAQTYDSDRVIELYWKPVLEELAKPREVPPLNGKGESRQVRRARERKAAKA